MPGLPAWYLDHWQALLLMQAFCGVLPFAWALDRRRHYISRTFVFLTVGAAFIDFLSSRIWTVHPLLQLGGIAVLYIILIGAIFICFDVSLWSAMFLSSSGYILQNIASCLKALLHHSEYFGKLMASTPGVRSGQRRVSSQSAPRKTFSIRKAPVRLSLLYCAPSRPVAMRGMSGLSPEVM